MVGYIHELRGKLGKDHEGRPWLCLEGEETFYDASNARNAPVSTFEVRRRNPLHFSPNPFSVTTELRSMKLLIEIDVACRYDDDCDDKKRGEKEENDKDTPFVIINRDVLNSVYTSIRGIAIEIRNISVVSLDL
ncbi:hypothetical protein V1477_011285 [Vespula maculifrons]|uniref:Uncharacterized protein n=1 Tax=Vespula maculifrons TaxID=7453 RepID=A0ABD2C4C5_VESMC